MDVVFGQTSERSQTNNRNDILTAGKGSHAEKLRTVSLTCALSAFVCTSKGCAYKMQGDKESTRNMGRELITLLLGLLG